MPNHNGRWIAGVLLAGAMVVAACALYYFSQPRTVKMQPPPPPPTEPWNDFSGEKALAHVRALVDLGPRPATSEALKRARSYIIWEL